MPEQRIVSASVVQGKPGQPSDILSMGKRGPGTCKQGAASICRSALFKNDSRFPGGSDATKRDAVRGCLIALGTDILAAINKRHRIHNEMNMTVPTVCVNGINDLVVRTVVKRSLKGHQFHIRNRNALIVSK